MTEENLAYVRMLMEEYGLWEFRHARLVLPQLSVLALLA